MYYDKFFPFFVSHAGSSLYEDEGVMEQEFELMKSWYPKAARAVQEQAENECRLVDYEGSPIYDEYPDKLMLGRMCARIRQNTEKILMPEGENGAEIAVQGMNGGFLDDLIETVLYQEISRRRCRRFRCRSYGGWGPGRPGGPGGWGPGGSGGPGGPGRPGNQGGPGGPGGPGGQRPIPWRIS